MALGAEWGPGLLQSEVVPRLMVHSCGRLEGLFCLVCAHVSRLSYSLFIKNRLIFLIVISCALRYLLILTLFIVDMPRLNPSDYTVAWIAVLQIEA